LLNRFGGLFATQPAHNLAALSRRIPSELAPQRLQARDLSDLEPDLAKTIRHLAGEPAITRAAKDIGCDPVVLVIALSASAAAPRDTPRERDLGRPANRPARSAVRPAMRDGVPQGWAKRGRGVAIAEHRSIRACPRGAA